MRAEHRKWEKNTKKHDLLKIEPQTCWKLKQLPHKPAQTTGKQAALHLPYHRQLTGALLIHEHQPQKEPSHRQNGGILHPQ